MKGVAFWFFMLATICALAGMALGIHMSAAQDFTYAPVHAHINLIGWVSMALFGVYYHLVPRAAEGMLAKVHFAVATAGFLIIVPGIVMAVDQTGETLAKIGSALTILSMAIFAWVVFSTRER